jgi:lauroyl/myristoyl acyltransferase
MALIKTVKQISSGLEELVRIASLKVLLSPGALFLPKRWAIRLANALSLLLVISPATGPRIYWQMRRVFGRGRFESFRLAWGWLGRGYRDFVIYKRILLKRENPKAWEVIERNVENINKLRGTGESYIVAGGHFLQALSFTMYSPTITYGNIIRVSDPIQNRSWKLKTLRIRYQFGMHLKALLSCYEIDKEIIFVEPDLRAAKRIYNRIRKEGNVVFIDIDAWPKYQRSNYMRPFAGFKNRAFATGTVQLARMARCPIICCIYYLDNQGKINLEWGEPIRNIGENLKDHVKVMDELLDKLEIAIGNNPTQYALEIGEERRWNQVNRRWEEL